MTPISEADGFEYRSPEACQIVGVTYRKLDYWARTGLVKPSIRRADGSGSGRLWSFEDLVELKLVESLVSTGMTIGAIRDGLEAYRNEKYRTGTGLGIYLLASSEHGWSAVQVDGIETGALTVVTIVSIDWIRLVVEDSIFRYGRRSLAAV